MRRPPRTPRFPYATLFRSPVRPIVPAEWTPVVEMVRDAAAGENVRQAVRLAAVLERAGAGRQMDVAAGELREQRWIAEVRKIVDRDVEVEVVVVGAVHEAL